MFTFNKWPSLTQCNYSQCCHKSECPLDWDSDEVFRQFYRFVGTEECFLLSPGRLRSRSRVSTILSLTDVCNHLLSSADKRKHFHQNYWASPHWKDMQTHLYAIHFTSVWCTIRRHRLILCIPHHIDSFKEASRDIRPASEQSHFKAKLECSHVFKHEMCYGDVF